MVVLSALAVLVLLLGFIKELPSIARYYNNRGARLQQQAEIKAAIKAYDRALSLNSGYAEGHYNLADAYEEIPNYEKALEEYQRAIDADLTFYPA
jgi:tetratricopeptide (TPR) repeat protein